MKNAPEKCIKHYAYGILAVGMAGLGCVGILAYSTVLGASFSWFLLLVISVLSIAAGLMSAYRFCVGGV